jgi:hypothetical protein
MLRFFLFMAGVMAASTGTAGDVLPCPGDTVPIQIMTPGRGGSEIKRSAAEISDLPHFRAFVTAVTEHVAARLAQDKLCINSAGGMESIASAAANDRSLLQFVHWNLVMGHEFRVPVLPIIGGQPSSCRISSPWIDLDFTRGPVPQIRSVVRWNERQFIADQAVLAGAKNVPARGMMMPLIAKESGYFFSEYVNTERLRQPAAKPIEERVPPDLLWLFRRTGGGEFFGAQLDSAMRRATEKGAEGYTKLVIALIDRCFASDRVYRYYHSILDAADLIPLEQYRIDMPIH